MHPRLCHCQLLSAPRRKWPAHNVGTGVPPHAISHSVINSVTKSIHEIQLTDVHGRGRSSPRNAFISLATVCCSIVLVAISFAASGADPNKVLHVALVAPETGFDPQAASDLYSNYVNREIFDPLYKYDYLARPYKVIANTAAALPDISADDLINPPELGILEREIKRVPNGKAIVLPLSPETRGHGTHTIATVWKQYLEELLASSARSN